MNTKRIKALAAITVSIASTYGGTEAVLYAIASGISLQKNFPEEAQSLFRTAAEILADTEATEDAVAALNATAALTAASL